MIIPELRCAQRQALSRPHLLRKAFSFTPTWHDEATKSKQGDSNEYGLLLVISACCTLGLFRYNNGCWWPTRLGYMISMCPSADPVEMVRSFPFTEKEVLNARAWAKKVLLNSENRYILDGFIKGFGLSPCQLETLGDNAVQVCAALVTVGMASFFGYNFEPTLYGLWFIVSPESPLNKKG